MPLIVKYMQNFANWVTTCQILQLIKLKLKFNESKEGRRQADCRVVFIGALID